MKFVKHILAPYDKKGQVQRCLICGYIIHDYRGAAYENAQSANHNGWAPGEHYVSRTANPQTFVSSVSDTDEVTVYA